MRVTQNGKDQWGRGFIILFLQKEVPRLISPATVKGALAGP